MSYKLIERSQHTDMIFRRKNNEADVIESIDMSDVNIRGELEVAVRDEIIVKYWKLPPNCTFVCRGNLLVDHFEKIDWNSVNLIQITDLLRHEYVYGAYKEKLPADYIEFYRDYSMMYVKNDISSLSKVSNEKICMFAKCLHVTGLHKRYIPKPIFWKIVTYYLQPIL